MKSALAMLPVLLATASLSACGPQGGVDTSCDVTGVTHEIEHILSETEGDFGEIVNLTCADDWAATEVTVVDGDSERTEEFLLRGTDNGWILTSTVEACDPAGALAAPEALRDEVCSN